MSLATATWVPGFEQWRATHGDGGNYTDLAHPKLVWHTSETPAGSLDGIIRDMLSKQHTDVYHIAADISLRRVAQFLPLNISASALAHKTVETNHDGALQVCIIGRAHDMPSLDRAQLAWLGREVVAPIARLVPELHLDIIATFYGDDAGFVVASPLARQRMGRTVWDNFNGQCGHQHVPDNDHWDPGRLDVAAITRAAHAEQPALSGGDLVTTVAFGKAANGRDQTARPIPQYHAVLLENGARVQGDKPSGKNFTWIPDKLIPGGNLIDIAPVIDSSDPDVVFTALYQWANGDVGTYRAKKR